MDLRKSQKITSYDLYKKFEEDYKYFIFPYFEYIAENRRNYIIFEIDTKMKTRCKIEYNTLILKHSRYIKFLKKYGYKISEDLYTIWLKWH